MKIIEIQVAQRKRLARLTGTTDKFLQHLQSGRRSASADMATRIEKSAKRMGLDVPRESLCAACGRCDLARKARKA